jgi:hypothetical protein
MLITLEFLESWNFEIQLPVEVRTNEILEKYNKHKKYLKSNNINQSQYIINKYLNDKKYFINENAYPYNIGQNMAHYVLWIHPNYITKISDLEVCNIITNKMIELGYNEYFCFENHIKAKSILGVLHYQVFFRKC